MPQAAASQLRAIPGAYGLALAGVQSDRLLASVPASSPRLEISVEIGTAEGREQVYTEEVVEAPLLDNGWLSVTRAGKARFLMPRPMSPDELVHPWLVPAAGVVNIWHGRHVAHGGAVCIEERALGVLGDREDGKSTLLAWLSNQADIEVLADDLLVVDDHHVLAGPRCIDLRTGSLPVVTGAHEHRLVRDGTRLRLLLPGCRRRTPLHGMIVLDWGSGEAVSLTRLGAGDALRALLPHAQPLMGGRGLLELLDVPVWRLTRPRTWDSLREVEALLRSVVT